MEAIPDGSIDMILADLPYGTTACKWDTVIPFGPLWVQYKRVIKRNGAIVLFGSQPFTSALVMSNPKWFKWEDVWDKQSVTGHLNAKVMPLRRHENILVFGQGRITYNPKMRIGLLRAKGGAKPEANKGCYGRAETFVSVNDTYYPTSVIAISNAHQSIKEHPTQKPVALMEYLIRTYTNEGETVLDNTMGSGSTGVACVNTNRNFIGIEQDAGYFEIASKRIEAAQSKARQSELELVGWQMI
jgi:site-specific DNA-methyltransferase (adenine-specific)